MALSHAIQDAFAPSNERQRVTSKEDSMREHESAHDEALEYFERVGGERESAKAARRWAAPKA